jgi:hypothetical protein
MKRMALVAVLMTATLSLASGCWHHHRRVSVTARDVRPAASQRH